MRSRRLRAFSFALLLAATTAKAASAAQSPAHSGLPASAKVRYDILTRFAGSPIQHPLASLTFDAHGNLYGTAMNGSSPYTYGGVFELAGAQTERLVYGFDGSNATQPEAGVTFDAAGDLFGTTIDGVYEITSAGREKELQVLAGGPEGGYSFSNLVADGAGNLYGTASEGGFFRGACKQIFVGCGVIFRVSPAGKYSVVHKFVWTDGSSPAAGLTLDTQGNLYGTTQFGGATGWGTVFEWQPSSGRLTDLYGFSNGADGSMPDAGVIFDSNGNLYGTTRNGGFAGNQQCDSGCGVVFEVSSGGRESVLHAFTAVPDGAFPVAALLLDSSGNLYGTTQQGGQLGVGTVFALTTSGAHYRVLHDFGARSDGSGPAAALTSDALGNLYGTTENGGSGAGTVFELTPPGNDARRPRSR